MKKMTLFLSGQAQKLLPTNKRYGTPRGVLVAMAFPHNLVKAAMEGYYLSSSELQTLGGDAWRFFDPAHYEGECGRKAIFRAYRIEGVISIGINDTITLDLSFYDKGIKKPFFVINLSFDRIQGTICALGSRSQT